MKFDKVIDISQQPGIKEILDMIESAPITKDDDNTIRLTFNDLEWHIDPTGKFREENISLHALLRNVGIIPSFFIDCDDPLQEAIKRYNYPVNETTEGDIRDLIFYYPDDPPQYPVIKTEIRDKIYCIYHYGVISIINKDDPEDWIIVRMD